MHVYVVKQRGKYCESHKITCLLILQHVSPSSVNGETSPDAVCWLFKHWVVQYVDCSNTEWCCVLTVQTLSGAVCWLFKHWVMLHVDCSNTEWCCMLTVQTLSDAVCWLFKYWVMLCVDCSNTEWCCVLTVQTLSDAVCWLFKHWVMLTLDLHKTVCHPFCNADTTSWFLSTEKQNGKSAPHVSSTGKLLGGTLAAVLTLL